MTRLVITFLLLVTNCALHSQSITTRLNDAFKNVESDPQLTNAIMSLYVVDSKDNHVVFNKNSNVGLAPASCQKVITSVAALDLLGSDYRYKTILSYEGKVENEVLKGNLHIEGNGDPTFGSWRWPATKEDQVLKLFVSEIKKSGIKRIEGTINCDDSKWGSSTIPDGWIWQDIGNYYGAGSSSLNWRENQYDLFLRSGPKIGDTCEIVSISPNLYQAKLVCEVTTAAKGSGDNAFIYLPPYSNYGFIRGTIPLGETSFKVSGSFPNSSAQFLFVMGETLKNSGITERGVFNSSDIVSAERKSIVPDRTLLYTHLSPSLDSINHWFLKKSINLYGEALVKTLAHEKNNSGSTEKGIDIIKYFWSQRGIQRQAINISDGSGLSPQNRVTTRALVTVMQYARSRPWFGSFYNALPEFNGIKMKSGAISGVRSFTGYIKSKAGNEYTFAIIVNNFDGNAGQVVRKMWAILDILK